MLSWALACIKNKLASCRLVFQYGGSSQLTYWITSLLITLVRTVPAYYTFNSWPLLVTAKEILRGKLWNASKQFLSFNIWFEAPESRKQRNVSLDFRVLTLQSVRLCPTLPQSFPGKCWSRFFVIAIFIPYFRFISSSGYQLFKKFNKIFSNDIVSRAAHSPSYDSGSVSNNCVLFYVHSRRLHFNPRRRMVKPKSRFCMVTYFFRFIIPSLLR